MASITARRKVQITPKATPAVPAHPHHPNKQKSPYPPTLYFLLFPSHASVPDSYGRTTQKFHLVCVAERPQTVCLQVRIQINMSY